ncbi:hypothetical protein, partial [Legionella moravica]
NAHVPDVHSAFFSREIVQPALKASRSVGFDLSTKKMLMYLMYTLLFLVERSCNLHSKPAVQLVSISRLKKCSCT